jgi:hypothetical protein
MTLILFPEYRISSATQNSGILGVLPEALEWQLYM